MEMKSSLSTVEKNIIVHNKCQLACTSFHWVTVVKPSSLKIHPSIIEVLYVLKLAICWVVEGEKWNWNTTTAKGKKGAKGRKLSINEYLYPST